MGADRRISGEALANRPACGNRWRLADATRVVFARAGFEDVSIDLIAEDADSSHGAFYSDFAPMDEQFLILLIEHLDA
jgi:AcrR family transcriptional regulator